MSDKPAGYESFVGAESWKYNDHIKDDSTGVPKFL